MSHQLPPTREDRIDEAIRDLGEQVRELRRELDELVGSIHASSQARSQEALSSHGTKRHA